MTLTLKADAVTVPDRATLERAERDAVLGEDLLGWAGYLMNAAHSAARELLEAASVLLAGADSDVDRRQRASQLVGAELRDSHTSPDDVKSMRRALDIPDA
jgi:hypothetical protein